MSVKMAGSRGKMCWKRDFTSEDVEEYLNDEELALLASLVRGVARLSLCIFCGRCGEGGERKSES